MYKISFDKNILKFFEKHRWDSIILKFKESIDILKNNPFDNNLDIKSLKWLENNYRLRIWKYRFLYCIENKILTIYFYMASSRGDVYKK